MDWRPFDYLTLTTLVPMPDAPKILMSYAFTENGDGTHVEIRIAKPKPKDQAFLDKVVANFKEHITHEVEVLQGILKERLGAPPPLEEPALPASADRFLTQPVVAS